MKNLDVVAENLSVSNCSFCQTEMENTLYCSSCSKIQNITDYFALFAFPFEYDIDLDILEQRYFKLQTIFHPDKLGNFANKQQALNISIMINDAYKILSSPRARAEYMLLQKGIRVNSENDNVKPDALFLAYVLEQREEIEQTNDLESKIDYYQLLVEKSLEDFKNHFSKEEYELAGKEIIKFRYLEKLIEQVKLNESTSNT